MQLTDVLIAAAVVLALYLLYTYLFASPSTASTASALHDASQLQIVKASSLPTNVSTNYACSIWFYINDWSHQFGLEKTIYERGQGSNAAPRVWLGKTENDVTVSVPVWDAARGGTHVQECIVNNVPLQAWTNMIVSLNGRALDVYINGKLVKTCLLTAPPKSSGAADVNITPDGGFGGYTSGFQYFSRPLGPQQAYDIYASGYGGGSSLGSLFDKYRVRIGLVENDRTVAKFEL